MAQASRKGLRLAVPLAMAAGFADAVSYLASGVFAANMTGNTVLAAMSLAQGRFDVAAERGLTIAVFFVGALAGALLLRMTRLNRSVPIFAEAALILLAAVVERRAGLAVPLIAAAMGMQATLLMRVGQATVSTVVVTTALARVASFCASVVGANKADLRQATEEIAPVTQLSIWACYALGAIIAVGTLHLTARPLYVPAAALIAAAAAIALRGAEP